MSIVWLACNFGETISPLGFASFRASSLPPSLRAHNRFSRRPLARSLARQGLAYQSTNCSMSQLYRYLINYKRAIAAAVLRHRPTLRGFSTLSAWFLLHASHVNYNSAPRFLNCRYRYRWCLSTTSGGRCYPPCAVRDSQTPRRKLFPTRNILGLVI